MSIILEKALLTRNKRSSQIVKEAFNKIILLDILQIILIILIEYISDNIKRLS